MTSSTDQPQISDEWCARHFDFTAPQLGSQLNETLEHMRAHCPVTYSETGKYWVVTRYQDVLDVLQDWRTFSSASKAPGGSGPPVPMIPTSSDPPLHGIYKRLINPFLTPSAVAPYEQATRELARRLIDGFIEAGECEFMAQFARPLPGLVFFDQVLHAPGDEIAEINEMATAAGMPGHPKQAESWQGLFTWVIDFVARRREQPPRGDLVDNIINSEVEDRPITDAEIYGMLTLLIMGGLETTAGSLGQFVIRFAQQPELAARLRAEPELIPKAVEELLRLDPPFICILRTVTRDTELGGQAIKQGEQVLIYWASANRDEAEFASPAEFDLSRKSNRQLAFGAGPHRCVGSNLARMNLRISVEELLGRLDDIQLQDGADIQYHNGFNRAPLTVPITFTPEVCS